ncbi:hypothetical protein COT70_02050 [candidate division WWE3 bacterium CG09_land_8_20_14_0_10_47_33]|uniref:Uncharacterized protein n=1 Tax=candidate division WWE3 bacterium CG_4_9_14_0_2_um_filter_48_10 TaxID=1975078 RepID=A0A2M8EJL4_UNCKA|nr:MAG: hypothetical protein COT70_02050 [candidate division WWE3 bacterium CG09_land_8_20_14_0_10_47_33]PIZ41003.1 MAG: hypothetical protein COY35_01275 [candidate division WWE3 bacterium CG_4_10_14_0_2_um_filter_47_8]PJC22936.1 MAG: hypothetical protein CO059_00965 [candidate division WWE3 bacterium CG_4_9_14_0_2_um_filter_48_10]
MLPNNTAGLLTKTINFTGSQNEKSFVIKKAQYTGLFRCWLPGEDLNPRPSASPFLYCLIPVVNIRGLRGLGFLRTSASEPLLSSRFHPRAESPRLSTGLK